MSNRVGRAHRATSESQISVDIDLDGTGQSDISTGLPFFDHMLTAFATHGSFDLTVQAEGDVEVDAHHTVEDTAIVLGTALREAVGDKAGIRRFGSQLLPMDEALVEAVVDFSGRAYFVMNGEPEHLQWQIIGGHYATVINRHFFETLATHAAVTRALRGAVELDPRQTGIPSTKGAL